MFEQISRIIKSRVTKFSFKKEILAVEVCQLWPEILTNLFNDKITDQTRALCFKDGTLTIKTANPALAQELQSEKERIISLLNKKLGQSIVKKLLFRI